MGMVRQTILLRNDLNLPKGLSEAQVAHLHFEKIRQLILVGFNTDNNCLDGTVCKIKFHQETIEWLKAPYTFVHGVPNVEVLDYFKRMAREKGVEVTDWHDTIFVKVSDTQKIVCENVWVGIVMMGESDKIKSVIGDLPLLN